MALLWFVIQLKANSSWNYICVVSLGFAWPWWLDTVPIYWYWLPNGGAAWWWENHGTNSKKNITENESKIGNWQVTFDGQSLSYSFPVRQSPGFLQGGPRANRQKMELRGPSKNGLENNWVTGVVTSPLYFRGVIVGPRLITGFWGPPCRVFLPPTSPPWCHIACRFPQSCVALLAERPLRRSERIEGGEREKDGFQSWSCFWFA